MDKKIIANTLIRRLGGTTKAARYFEVEPPSVSEWRENGMPRARILHLRAARPDWFDSEGIAIPMGSLEGPL
jgi:hypothetical protein